MVVDVVSAVETEKVALKKQYRHRMTTLVLASMQETKNNPCH